MKTLPLPTEAPAAPRRAATLGGLLIADALLSFAPLLVLGAAIGWPASLRRPAIEQLVAIHAHADAVTLGYGLYLLYSMLVAPVMIGMAAHTFGGLQQPLAATVAAFGSLSTLARSVGVLRWLTVLPALATAHAGADPAARAQIELVFDAVTRFGGGIGELLGVSLFMAVSLGTLSIGALRHGGLPRWLAVLGSITAALLGALALPALGVPVAVPIAAPVSALTVWMLVAGVWCLRQPR